MRELYANNVNEEEIDFESGYYYEDEDEDLDNYDYSDLVAYLEEIKNKLLNLEEQDKIIEKIGLTDYTGSLIKAPEVLNACLEESKIDYYITTIGRKRYYYTFDGNKRYLDRTNLKWVVNKINTIEE